MEILQHFVALLAATYAVSSQWSSGEQLIEGGGTASTENTQVIHDVSNSKKHLVTVDFEEMLHMCIYFTGLVVLFNYLLWMMRLVLGFRMINGTLKALCAVKVISVFIYVFLLQVQSFYCVDTESATLWTRMWNTMVSATHPSCAVLQKLLNYVHNVLTVPF